MSGAVHFGNLIFLQERPFDFDLISYPVIKMSEQLCNIYKNIPSIELWNLNIVDFTLSQIEYHTLSGGFRDPNDALIMCDRASDLMSHLKTMAVKGQKFLVNSNPENTMGATFDLYHNEMIYTNNTIVVSTDKGKAVFSGLR